MELAQFADLDGGWWRVCNGRQEARREGQFVSSWAVSEYAKDAAIWRCVEIAFCYNGGVYISILILTITITLCIWHKCTLIKYSSSGVLSDEGL